MRKKREVLIYTYIYNCREGTEEQITINKQDDESAHLLFAALYTDQEWESYYIITKQLN